MEVYHKLVLLSSTIFLILSACSATVDRVYANQPIKDGNTIVSDGEKYELGFFSPGNSKYRYLGIWYKKISTFTVVWVANRETPISDTSGVFVLTTEGNLQIYCGGNSNTIIWSSNSTVSVKNIPLVLQLLDSGNLVVWDKSSTIKSPIWQSSDYHGNTLLPDMKMGNDFIAGRTRYLTSWKSPNDPSVGLYKLCVHPNGYPQVWIFGGKGLVEHSRFGPWNGIGYRGFPVQSENPIYSEEFVANQNESYFRYKCKNSGFQRIVLMSDGALVMMNWIERTKEWVVYTKIVIDSCSHYGHCGPYGNCNMKLLASCGCMEGFEPRVLEEWNSGDWSSGCQRKTPLGCGTRDGFTKISGVKFPDTRRAWYNVSMSLKECEMTCIMNCSCSAFATLDIRNGGSGCLLWFDELMDMREYDDHQELYIRMPISELQVTKAQSSFKRKKEELTLMLSVSSAAMLLCAVAYVYRKKTRRPNKKARGYSVETHDGTGASMENLDDLPFFSLDKLAKATDNFNNDNKIGEGGFGPVYKGVLEDGQTIAVKRLAESSQQGIDEFRNEVICIAKLQHRNLVKLLGYCIHQNEMILIYEYMVNGSLDSFVFDETRSSMLDWPHRFLIIHGMARGILYLHQDSRLQIIHRDLKAGNILLDSEMNPKISDFGLARKFVGQDDETKTKKVVGTYGYISPEYAVHGNFSTKSDVFSFGVIVLEIVSGRKNRGFFHEGHGDNLLGHAWRLYKEDKSIELMTPSLRNSCVISEVIRSIQVGLLCVQHHAEDRPTMLSVVLMLISDGALPSPKQPAFFTEERHRELDTVSSAEEYMLTLLYAR